LDSIRTTLGLNPASRIERASARSKPSTSTFKTSRFSTVIPAARRRAGIVTGCAYSFMIATPFLRKGARFSSRRSRMSSSPSKAAPQAPRRKSGYVGSSV
jgi:hypothetical protein